MALSRAEYLDIYRRHLVDDVIGWWLARAPDDLRGGVFTCWSNDGARLVSRDKYTWSQGRWCWMMARFALAAHAGRIEINAEQCVERAIKTAIFIRDRLILPDGSTTYVASESGEPKSAAADVGFHTSIFADLFVALGFAATAAASGEIEWGERAEVLLASAWERIRSGPVPTEPYPIPVGFKSFALPMILVGVGSECHRATGSPVSAACVRWAASEIEGIFLSDGDIAEYVPDRESDADTLLARHRTPGHVLEACWFLLDAGRSIRAHADESMFAVETLCGIATRAVALGWDEQKGGLLRYVDREGLAPRGRLLGHTTESLVSSTWDTKLWWPHAEALYALRLLAEEGKRADLAAHHARMHDYVMRIFPNGRGNEWIQIRDRNGEPLEKTVALPVKDPFHIARALLLLVELLADPETRQA